jgi:hypothetical protein
MNKYTLTLICMALLSALPFQSTAKNNTVTTSPSTWLLIDDFEASVLDRTWQKRDTRNDTSPYIPNPQITKIVKDDLSNNNFLIKKPAAEGIVGNRKALTFRELPQSVAVGEVFTFFTRINIEYFPNNHVFGLSNLDAEGIKNHDYNALEPSIRITDKFESSGFKNDGTIMVKIDKGYSNIQNYEKNQSAKPAKTDVWYDIWYVVNNATLAKGGQIYDVYIRGGEFPKQTLVYKKASFRMKRELPLIYFMMNTNTGPVEKPYGNGGLRYDDIYMAKGIKLSSPM